MSTSSATKTTPTATTAAPALATTNPGGTPRPQTRARQATTQPTWQNGDPKCPTILIGKYQATIYPEGQRVHRVPSASASTEGRTASASSGRPGPRQHVKDKLIQAVKDLESGIETSESYTVAEAVNDWLAKGLKSRGEDTVTVNRILADQHLIPLIGATKLKEADRRRRGRLARRADRQARPLSSLQGRAFDPQAAIRQAQARDKVLRNVAELVTTPKGKAGRPSRAMTLDQATAMLEQAKASRLHAYVVVSLLTGIRTEEARALRWSHVVAWAERRAAGCRSPKPGSITSGSPSTSGAPSAPTATPRPRSPAARWSCPPRQPRRSATHRARQARERLAAGTMLAGSRPRVRQPGRHAARRFPRPAGLQGDHQEGRARGNWTPRELRHSFVSIMSDNGVPIETIADLVGTPARRLPRRSTGTSSSR